MIKVGIIGGAGYTAGELIRILLNHPKADIAFIQSTSQAGLLVSNIHTDLVGETTLAFISEPDYSVDVLFLCMGHGKSRNFVNAIPKYYKGKIIDLSHDFRLKEKAEGYVYGLPELNRKAISEANKIANPGCFATAIQLALLPLADAKVLKEVHVHAITGSTGAGQAASSTTHFSWRNNNVSVYKSFEHQHLGEIGESLVQLQADFTEPINFVPIRGNHSRGILASVYMDCELSEEKVHALFETYYSQHSFTIVVKNNPDIKQVVNTNKALVYIKKYDKKIHIISVIDNLLKGASGQAIQNMNLLFGLDEAAGLQLKPVAF